MTAASGIRIRAQVPDVVPDQDHGTARGRLRAGDPRRRAQARPRLRPGLARDARVARGQLPVGHGDDQRHVARAARQPVSRADRASDGRRWCCSARAGESPDARGRSRSAAPTTSRAGVRCRRSPTRATPATPDEIWLTEHPPVYTLGLAGRREHVRDTRGVDVIQVDRGGQVTFHGPGQLVVYLLVDLRRCAPRRSCDGAGDRDRSDRLPRFGRRHCVRESPRHPACTCCIQRRREAKIAALGLKVRNGCTYHGLALNVAMDLTPFAAIDPCGYPGLAVTSLADLGVPARVEDAGAALAPRIAKHACARRHDGMSDPITHATCRATPPASSTRATARPRVRASRSRSSRRRC